MTEPNESIVTATALLFLLSACAGTPTAQNLAAPSSSALGQPDLLGRITNENGIRDDVNEYILAAFADAPARRMAAIRLAQSNQRILETVASDRPVTQELVTKVSYAGWCFAKSMDKKSFLKHAREITARSFNTEARFRAHDEFAKQAYGMSVATVDHVDPCEAAN